MKKKNYEKPLMRAVEIGQEQCLLTASVRSNFGEGEGNDGWTDLEE